MGRSPSAGTPASSQATPGGQCTHLGCTVPWKAAQSRFACPCHASVFDITGQVLSAPAPHPLDFYEARIENGLVKVDTRPRQQRTAFDTSQVTVG